MTEENKNTEEIAEPEEKKELMDKSLKEVEMKEALQYGMEKARLMMTGQLNKNKGNKDSKPGLLEKLSVPMNICFMLLWIYIIYTRFVSKSNIYLTVLFIAIAFFQFLALIKDIKSKIKPKQK
jgi:hypothetical protein